jgi:hypothetical protein
MGEATNAKKFRFTILAKQHHGYMSLQDKKKHLIAPVGLIVKPVFFLSFAFLLLALVYGGVARSMMWKIGCFFEMEYHSFPI